MGHSVALAYDFFSWRAVLDILLISAGLFFLHRTLLRLGTWKIMAGIVLGSALLHVCGMAFAHLVLKNRPRLTLRLGQLVAVLGGGLMLSTVL